MRNIFLILCCVLLGAGVGCSAMDKGSDGDKPKAVSGNDAHVNSIPKGSKLYRVKGGMLDYKVRKMLGNPDNISGHLTGKSWIPFYWGSDASRTTWKYEGLGRVVFSRNRYNGEMRVVQVKYNPKELK